ncbi:MAG: IS66 family insertion sequence element accessory protein TnpB [Alphaproteobacteria bacterium]|nr:IS66 family insertion sequence element accessory protein TnpB [Alphaproteobacteria bacterium]MBU1279235.1 IS66 family insertion sequence element accessory protein TnpB [Alphaproteobacteria bacterium]MBU1573749.1 IS66 family insertion sequence element accessory protein TnpB [Alphaproteobacteria bacterium]MBU1828292.1 IS66 family insertion sequence element accessory protein TnpB [Alphaproteobacteria bacterium]MBU2077628.1 IS66 family insertion sequence element accessory protein TnpB [Alphaprot
MTDGRDGFAGRCETIEPRPVDFRCGHNALALIVQTELKLDPHSGVTVVFRSSMATG